ncbi:ATP-binding SpoIIE family protein phosphatase [Oceanospirillum sediminis]|uniref:Fused response regulator/phosphatase n=1 Tax=Oceanospirillum sediminis TaxID=2760088 RepID=A0A839IPH8_9GAMM|nr:fused response regulator/phosphatase [Oceanospirillum sediminis]MBB1486831.1 fused response regulator/phosphatase [Oceanospirillum sediminis]
MRILAVDDTRANLVLLQAMLKRAGHEVVTADNGEHSLEVFQQESPDLVLMDVMMPGMDGFEAAQRLQEIAAPRWVPIIFISAAATEEYYIKGHQSGGADYLFKPINQVILNTKIESIKRVVDMQNTLASQNKVLQEYVDKDEEERRISRHIMEHMAESKGLEDPMIRYMLTPAEQFSGDVLCAARSPSNRLFVLLGDAVGHGLAAAINTLPISGTFYSMVYKGFELSTIGRELNRRIKETMPTGCFVACGIVMIDPAESYVEVWNAGLPTFYCVDSHGHVSDTFESNQLPLGVLGGNQYEVESHIISYQAGNQIIMFSDGLIEAENSEGEFFGIERLLSCLHHPENRLDDIKHSLGEFLGDEIPHDDVTLALVDMPSVDTVASEAYETLSDDVLLTTIEESSEIDWKVNFHMGVSEIKSLDLTPMLLGIITQFRGLESHNQKLFLILSELLNNALDHGLLELDSALKTGPDAFETYLNARQSRLREIEKGFISITACKISINGTPFLRITIDDSGKGFDYQKVFGNSAENVQMHGRGIKLVKQLCHAMEYTGNGNSVTVDYSLEDN